MMRMSVIGKNALLLAVVMIVAAAITADQVPEPKASTVPFLKDVTGEELQEVINSYEGEKAVLVNVWATWCAPCIEEFPYIVKLQRAYEDELKVIFVSADLPENKDRVKAFLEEHGVDWGTYFKTGKDKPFIESLSDSWSGALPFTKIINKERQVVASWEQGAGYEKFEKNIKTAIN